METLNLLAADMGTLMTIGAVVVGFFFLLLAFMVFFTRIYRKVDQGKALIVNTMKQEPDVTFTGRYVLPVFHRAEVMDISVKTMELDRRGKEGLICEDNIRADIKVTFFVRVNKTTEDVLKVAQSIGCKRASDQKTLEDLFIAKFSEALKTVGKQLQFVDLYTRRDEFRDQIIEIIGRDLNGYVLDDAAIDYLEQTPLEMLDRDNILDAEGIRKITDLTTREHISTNLFTNNEIKQIKKQDVERAEAVYELERNQAEALAKQQREIKTVQAREAAETSRVEAEEHLKAETAQIKTAEDLGVQDQNKHRQIEVAEKNRERVIGIEIERVQRDRDLEAISREKAVELERIFKEKALEVERKEIQDVIRQRVEVERAVAVEEEAIKEVRVVEEAKRLKEAVVIGAQAAAQEKLVQEVRAADASEQAARHDATKRIVLADAELQASEKEAQAKIRLAEGVRAEEAASGLAIVEVREADAVATEKTGRAEAIAIEAKLTAEAAGLTEKADAMKKLDGVGREHEEFRIQLEKEKDVEIAAIDANRKIAEAQAETLGKAFESADIDIIGGEGQFFDRILGAVSGGKALDEMAQNSDTGRALLGDYIDGKRSLPDDAQRLISGISSGDLRNLSIAALITKMMAGADKGTREKLGALVERAKELGLTDGRGS